MKISSLIYLSLFATILIGSIFYILFQQDKRETEKKQEIRTQQELRIVAFGDSLTYGFGLASIDDSYPAYLERLAKKEGYSVRVINMGVTGDTTADGLSRIGEVLSFEPKLVLLEFGANDFLRGMPADQAFAHLATMIETLQKHKIQVILLNVEPPTFLPLPQKEAYAVIAKNLSNMYGLTLVSSFLHNVSGKKDLMQIDRLHPTKEGYIVAVEKNIWPVLKKEPILNQ